MEELVYKLRTITKIKNAISHLYSDVKDADVYHDCMELINELEKGVLDNMELHLKMDNLIEEESKK